MNLKSFYYTLIIVVVSSCTSVQKSKSVEIENYEGWWISSILGDSMINNRTIYKSDSFIGQDAAMFQIKNDSIYAYGSLISQMKFPIKVKKDTIGKIEGMFYADIITNNKTLRLNAINKDDEYNEIFRKATILEENELTKNISKEYTIAKNLEKWFVKRVFAGKYKDENGNLISLKPNNDCEGYKKFMHYKTHFTDSTNDWMANDWIRFNNPGNDAHEIYHFNFVDDTLKLYNYSLVDVEKKWEIGSLEHTWFINE